jgi:hypothetical protein
MVVWMLRFVLAAVLAAVPQTCGLDQMEAPGQVNYRGTLTVINRTEAEVTVTSQREVISVAACSEATDDDFPLNWWDLTSAGRDTFRSGGGVHAQHSYLVVTSSVAQGEIRPDALPECRGLLQPAQQ